MPIGKSLLFKSVSSANYVSLQNCFKYKVRPTSKTLINPINLKYISKMKFI